MRTEDLILVSVDDHAVEPPDLFERWVPARWRDRAPKSVHKPDGTDVWLFEGIEKPNIGLNAVVGRRAEEYGIDPSSYGEMRSGCYDIHARVRDMDANGVLGSMCFPTVPQFCGQLFAKSSDKELAHVLLQSYNDWHVDEWCGTYPGRFIPLSVPPIWDPVLMADEVRRMAAKGCHAVTFSENPEKLGWPSFHSDHWDPFWSACVDAGTVVCLHIGSSSTLAVPSSDGPIDVTIVLSPINIVQAATDLLFSPVLRKFPGLRVALSEGGIGWIPYFLERIDYTYTHHHAWTGQDFGDMLPSQVFLERIIVCFIDDAFGLESRHHLNIDNITWECDYPHSDCTWPTSPEMLHKTMVGFSGNEVAKVTHLNAMQHFQYDPFSYFPPSECTVGALRARAADVDISPHSIGRRANTMTTSADLGALRTNV
jgi:predicted TIM-barrel fold metal-dependent hydrolase